MTSVACLVTRQMGVSPSKMNIGRSRFAGSSGPQPFLKSVCLLTDAQVGKSPLGSLGG